MVAKKKVSMLKKKVGLVIKSVGLQMLEFAGMQSGKGLLLTVCHV